MKAMKIVGISMVGAMALALSGCGGGSGGQAAAVPANPYAYGQGNYGQQMNQPYTCQAGYIQFRNAFGKPQCYPTTILSEACAQAGGLLAANGTTCRKERQISSRPIVAKYRSLFGTYRVRIPLPVQLFPGEALKVYGNVDSSSNVSDWDAQLLQNGVSVGSASSGSMMPSDGLNNLSITAISQNGTIPYVSQGQYHSQYNPYTGPNQIVGQYPYNGQYQSQYGEMAMIQNFSLEFMFRGTLRIQLDGAAVSCEDGRGNSYPCQ